MEVLLGLIVMLAGVSHAMVTTCNATQKSSQCSVSLGGTVYLQLMTNASGYEFSFKKEMSGGLTLIFTLKRNAKNVIIKGPTEARSQFFINNGTFKVTNVERNDSGQYFLDVYDSKGVSIGTRRIQLDIEEPMVLLLGSAAGASAVGLLLVVLVVGGCCIHRRRRRPLPQEPDIYSRPDFEGTQETLELKRH